MIHQPSSVQRVDSGEVSFLGHQSLNVITPVVRLETQGPGLEEIDDWPNQEQLQRLVRWSEDKNWVCQICGSFTTQNNVIMTHILTVHGDTWRTFEPALVSVSGASDQNTETVASISGPPTSENSASGSAPTPTIHLDKNWRSNLIKTFIEDAPNKWSEVSRNAWRNNEKITDPKTFKRVRQEIVENLITHCLGVFGDIKRPSEPLLRKLVEDLLAKQYPYMFSMEPGNAVDNGSLNHGRGLGGWSGEKYNKFVFT